MKTTLPLSLAVLTLMTGMATTAHADIFSGMYVQGNVGVSKLEWKQAGHTDAVGNTGMGGEDTESDMMYRLAMGKDFWGSTRGARLY